MKDSSNIYSRSGRAAALLLCVLLVLGVLFSTAGTASGEGPAKAFNASGDINRSLSVDPTGKSEGFSAVLYNNPNGLPTSEANAIAETGEGFIWIGSYAGLIRHDGNSFERMDSTNGITSVTCLFVDSHDRLWIGTNANGAAVMERGEFTMWDKRDGLQSSSIRAITEDENGLMYIASTAGIAVVNLDMTLEPLDDPRLENIYIRDIRLGPDGLIYGITQAGDIFTLKDKQIVFWLSGEVCRVKGAISFLPDPEQPGKLYLGTESAEIFYGTLEQDFEDMDIRNVAPLSYVECIEYIGGQIWICARNGIGNLGESGFHLLDNVPMDNSVGHVMTDYEGNLWFTSTRQGVMKVVPNQFSDLYEHCGLPPAVVNATCLYGDQLFCATDSGLTVIEDGKIVDRLPLTRATTASGEKLDAEDLLDFLDGVRIRSIIRDSKGRLWLSTWRKYGLLRYDKGELMAFTVADGLFSERIRVVCERQDGAIVAANTGGVCIIEGDEITGGYSAEDGIENGEILTVCEGMNGDLILGSDGGGIYIIGSEGTRHIGVDEGLGSEVIMRVKYSPNQHVFWIVTTNSLSFMDEDYQVTTIRNFPYPNNFDLYENSKGDMWILASNGVYVIPAKELLANGEIDAVHYDVDNGLPYMATANSYSELSAEGDLYMASSAGVTKVNIEKPLETHKLTVSSFVYNYSLMNPQVSYHLEGFDRTTTTVSRSELAPIDYTNLRGGTYRFVMQLRDSMGRGSQEMSVEINKEKAFYEQAWFYVVSGLAALLLTAAVIRYYIRQRMQKLERKNRETMTFVREITEAFAKVIDMKDKYTNGHSSRVAQYTKMLAEEMGCDDETVEKYYRIALLHDIGKIGVPPEVLNKPGKLTDDEFEIIKSHTMLGYETLKDISIMPELAIGAGSHHERPDGRGYPNHLKGDEIPKVAQIIAVADCFDAMYSNRPYRRRMNFEKVVSIIQEVSGTQLAPDVVDAFMRLVEKGELRDPNDHGGGSTENIENIRKEQDAKSKD